MTGRADKFRFAVINYRLILLLVALLAFALRVGVRLYLGEDHFWRTGYREYYNVAQSIRQGQGFCAPLYNYALLSLGLDQDLLGVKCAHLPPGYPLFLALAMGSGDGYLGVIVAQSLLGAGTAVCVFFLGRHFWGAAAGLLASLFVAVYPYYVWHDASLQETGIFTFLTLLSALLLYKAAASGRKRLWILSGISLGVAILTRASLAPFGALAIIWAGSRPGRITIERLLSVSLFVASLGATLAPWLVRNIVVLGSPILTSQTGRFLWIGNNAYTFAYYPSQSIDRSEAEAWRALAPEELEEIRVLANNEIGQQDWFFNKGIEFIGQHPLLTLWGALKKNWVAFSWNFSPAKERWPQLVYFFSYTPILVLGLVGLILTRQNWREYSLIHALFVAFIAGTGIFWAHTSHRTYLDVYLMVFASHTIRVIHTKSPTWLRQAHVALRRLPGSVK